MKVQKHIDTAVEAICQRGCREVRRIMGALAAGKEVVEAKGFSSAERQQLLQELEEIMRPYGESCPAEDSMAAGSERPCG